LIYYSVDIQRLHTDWVYHLNLIIMKKFGIIVAILGIALFVVSNFFYKKTSNAVDSSGSKEIVTGPNGSWTFKLPVFAGGALFVIGLVFFAASRTDNQHHDHLI